MEGNTDPGTVGNMKVLYLIRHAESMENVRVRSANLTIARMMACRLPSWIDFWRCVQLLRLDLDAPLSPHGETQLVDTGQRIIESKFVQREKLQLVVHSSRQRAVRTCRELLGSCDVPTIELEDIVERTPWEYCAEKAFHERVERFLRWLASRPESRIAIVGHGQFFFALQRRAGDPTHLRNVEVRKCNFNPSTCVVDNGVIVRLGDGAPES